jgi:hypothetical protein
VLALVAVEELGPVVCGQGVVASCFIFCSDLVRSDGLGSLPLDRSGIWRRRRLDAAWGPFDRGRCGGSPLCGAGGLDARWCLRSDGCYTRRDWCCILDWRRWCSKRWVGFGRFCGWPSVRLGVGQGRVLMNRLVNVRRLLAPDIYNYLPLLLFPDGATGRSRPCTRPWLV